MTIAAMLLCGAPLACSQAAQPCGFAGEDDGTGPYVSSTSGETCPHSGGGNIMPNQSQNFAPAGFEPLTNQNILFASDYFNGKGFIFFSEQSSPALVADLIQPDRSKLVARSFKQVPPKTAKALPSRVALVAFSGLTGATFLALPSFASEHIAPRVSYLLPAYSLISEYNREPSPVADDAQKWMCV